MSRRVWSVATCVLLVAAAVSGQADPPQSSAGDASALTGMTAVPPGLFWMGRARLYLGEEIGWLARDRTDDRPLHLVDLDAFSIDVREVTNADYARFVAVGDVAVPYHWGGQSPPADRTNHPVYNVTWEEASAYCAWAGRRLPTEAEWEKAARGGLQRLDYPWGNDFMSRPAVAPGSPAADTDVEPVRMAHTGSGFGPTEVGSFEPNGLGLYDVSGNVWEWVSDWYDTYYYSVSAQHNPQGPVEGHYKVTRGGGWGDPETRLATVYFRNFVGPDTRAPTLGFRCATSLPSQ